MLLYTNSLGAAVYNATTLTYVYPSGAGETETITRAEALHVYTDSQAALCLVRKIMYDPRKLYSPSIVNSSQRLSTSMSERVLSGRCTHLYKV